MTNSRALTYHGGGYCGLTGSVAFALAGWTVMIYDPDPATVAGINAGRPRAGDFLAYLDADVAQLVAEGRLRATTEWSEAVWAPVHVVAVPTEKDGEPHDAIVLGVLHRLFTDAAPGATILVESTLAPGTIDRVIADFERRQSLHLAVCPRRDWFADRDKNLTTLPRIVGGLTPACTARAVEILSTVSRDIRTTDFRTAELVKAVENALLHLPVTFGHQLAVALPHLNVAEALRLACTHWRFASLGSLYLGFGSGGRCIPLGTRYLYDATWGGSIARDQSFLDIGRAVIEADAMFAQAVVEMIEGSGRRVAILGVAYRPEFRDAGRSPGLCLAAALAEGDSAPPALHDPLWKPSELEAMAAQQGLTAVGLDDLGTLSTFDAVLLVTPHRAYRRLPESIAWRQGQLVLDGRGTWGEYRELFAAGGVDYRVVGEPGWMETRR